MDIEVHGRRVRNYMHKGCCKVFGTFVILISNGWFGNQYK